MINLTYFKQSGKYYAEGVLTEKELEPIPKERFWDIIEYIYRLNDEGNLPGLAYGSRGWVIHAVINEVPHIIFPKGIGQ